MSMRNDVLVSQLNYFAIISETDAQGKIIFANDLFCKISGHSAEELIGQDHRFINARFHSKEFFKELWETIKAKKMWRGEILNMKKDGTYYWVDSCIFPNLDEQNNIVGYFSIRYDITYLKKIKEEEATQHKLRTVGESTAQILHDIMTPLMIIDTSARSMLKKTDMESEISGKLEKIEVASQKIIAICKNFQALLHGSHQKEKINIYHEAHDTKKYLADKLTAKMIELTIKNINAETELLVMGNRIQMQQVLVNLVNNALDAIEKFDDEDRWIKIQLSADREHVYISIIDGGKGIDPKIQPKLFNSMFSTKELYKGTGLGLGICRKIIESFGGTIVINNDSPNTQFDIKLLKLKN